MEPIRTLNQLVIASEAPQGRAKQSNPEVREEGEIARLLFYADKVGQASPRLRRDSQ